MQQLLVKFKKLANRHNFNIGIYAYDLYDSKNAILLNEKRKFPAASLVKLIIALAILKKVESKKFSLSKKLICRDEDKIIGASIIADLNLDKYKIKDLLYFLLAHSDNTAQNILEQIVREKEINNFIKKNNLSRTKFVSLKKSTAKRYSTTTPQDMAILFRLIWQNKLLNKKMTKLLLSFLAKTRTSYFGLRYLPCRLNTKNPEIKYFYSKAGKLKNSVNDCLILVTKDRIFQINIFIDNLRIKKYRNNVDNEGIIILGKIVLELYNFLSRFNKKKSYSLG